MKKRIIGTVMALVLSLAMLTGCASSAEKQYRNDAKTFAGLEDAMEDISDDPEEMVKEMDSIIKGLKVSTPEGKALKEDLQNLVDLMDQALEISENMDTDKAMELYGNLIQLTNDVQQHLEDFRDAAVEAGVSESEFGDIDLDLGL